MNSVNVLFNGYSFLDKELNLQKANCSCTLIQGKNVKIIVDTLTSWDSDNLLNGELFSNTFNHSTLDILKSNIVELKQHHIQPESIDYVISTHGHSDHIGNNNLFLNAKQHFVGTSVSHKNIFYQHDFDSKKYLCWHIFFNTSLILFSALYYQ